MGSLCQRRYGSFQRKFEPFASADAAEVGTLECHLNPIVDGRANYLETRRSTSHSTLTRLVFGLRCRPCRR